MAAKQLTKIELSVAWETPPEVWLAHLLVGLTGTCCVDQVLKCFRHQHAELAVQAILHS